MYFDQKPCRECGSEVELRAKERSDIGDPDTGPDPTVDVRVCTNPACPTHEGTGGA